MQLKKGEFPAFLCLTLMNRETRGVHLKTLIWRANL